MGWLVCPSPNLHLEMMLEVDLLKTSLSHTRWVNLKIMFHTLSPKTTGRGISGRGCGSCFGKIVEATYLPGKIPVI